jgi:hypothetical protein
MEKVYHLFPKWVKKSPNSSILKGDPTNAKKEGNEYR